MDAADSALAELGLSPNEIAAYKALLKGGTARAADIARDTRLTRSTAQFTLQQMHKKGFISMVRRKNSYLFSADDTKRLLGTLDVQRAALEQKREHVARILPELDGMRGDAFAIPKVRLFEGADGVLAAWLEMVAATPAGSPLRSFSHPVAESHDNYGHFRKFVEARRRRKIPAHVIACSTGTAHVLKGMDAAHLRETRKMPVPCPHSHPAEIMIAPGMVCLAGSDSTHLNCTIIDSISVSQLMETMFDNWWAMAGTVSRG